MVERDRIGIAPCAARRAESSDGCADGGMSGARGRGQSLKFCFDDDQRLLGSTTRRYLEANHALADLRPLLEAEEVVEDRVWREGAELGWTSMLVPEEFGGGSVTNQPLVDLSVVARELGRMLYPGAFIPTNVMADAIARFGTDELRRHHLPRIATGEVQGGWCLTGDGSVEDSAIQVTADRSRGHIVLNGVACFVQGASTASLFLVAARHKDETVHVLVPALTPGIEVRNQAVLDLTRRFGAVTFTDLAVDDSAVLAEDRPEELTQRAIAVATILQAAEDVGAAEHIFERTVQYTKDRSQFGRPIGSFQAVKHRLADLFVSLEAMRAVTDYAALSLDQGGIDAHRAVFCAGAYVPDAFAHLSGEAVQLHGGIGFTWEHDAHLFVRRAKADQVLYGTGGWHRERLCRSVESEARATVSA